jgi:hypothetical protein
MCCRCDSCLTSLRNSVYGSSLHAARGVEISMLVDSFIQKFQQHAVTDGLEHRADGGTGGGAAAGAGA